MTNQALEQKANPKQGTENAEERITTRCHYCEKELQILKNYSLEKNRQYDGFYISPEGNPYCNKNHFILFTEA